MAGRGGGPLAGRAGKGRGPPQVPWNVLAKEEHAPGAKKGGVTEHLSGPHLIPNVGREAMVPAEVIRRRPPPRKQPNELPPAQKTALNSKDRKRLEKALKRVNSTLRRTHDERIKSRSRSRRCASRSNDASPRRSRSRSWKCSPSRERSVSGSRCSRSPSSEPRNVRPVSPPARTPTEIARRKAEEEEQNRLRAKEEELRRIEDERKVQELRESRQKQKEMAESRKKKLVGAFALSDDDMDGSTKDREDPQLVRRKALGSLAPTAVEEAPFATSSALAVPRDLRAVAPPPASSLLNESAHVTAADIDGAYHDHKFAKVWKDWDSSKKDNPGEVARQFMKIAAIKRRGQPRPGAEGSRARSRSRSRSRRRR
eukprot:TRINITY_DN35656_c0_g1_i2.p1 TRINITY_DN35656_c0_g1~~TRINITY_DN35656_c0_g1_i2.p1  ORF type:complete len:370 (-),score=58.86 TRINITY_DN35656_c0_g1_i2:191-1300(-)